jgi:alpha-mannosidase
MLDNGEHVFHHALHLAPGNWTQNDTGRQAALFNAGLTAVPGSLRSPLPGWGIEAGHSCLTAVKTAEDGRGLILRFAECAGAADIVKLVPPPEFRNAELCTVMEGEGEALNSENGVFSIPMGAWKIVTIRLIKK